MTVSDEQLALAKWIRDGGGALILNEQIWLQVGLREIGRIAPGFCVGREFAIALGRMTLEARRRRRRQR